MIVVDSVVINNTEFQRAYSDSNKYITRDSVLYEEAIDPIGIERMYTETDLEIIKTVES